MLYYSSDKCVTGVIAIVQFSFWPFNPPFPPPPPHTHLTARKIKIKKNEKGLEISSFSYVYQKLYSFSDMVLDGRTDGQRRTDGPMEKVIELGAPPNKKNIALQNHVENEAERLVRDLFLFFQNVLYEVKAKGLQLSFNISIFQYFSCYILLTDQTSLSDCIYFLTYWPIRELQLFVNPVLAA